MLYRYLILSLFLATRVLSNSNLKKELFDFREELLALKKNLEKTTIDNDQEIPCYTSGDLYAEGLIFTSKVEETPVKTVGQCTCYQLKIEESRDWLRSIYNYNNNSSAMRMSSNEIEEISRQTAFLASLSPQKRQAVWQALERVISNECSKMHPAEGLTDDEVLLVADFTQKGGLLSKKASILAAEFTDRHKYTIPRIEFSDSIPAIRYASRNVMGG